jgi:hypothetical protein
MTDDTSVVSPIPASTGPGRRTVLMGAGAVAAAAVLARPAIVRAASATPVKIGFIRQSLDLWHPEVPCGAAGGGGNQ